MAKKTKEQEIGLFYLKEEEKKKVKKQKVKKKPKKKNKKKKEKQEENQFSFENEIVIGVTKKEEPKKASKKQRKKQEKKPKKENKKERRTILPKKQEKKDKKKKKIVNMIKYTTLSILFITLILSAMYSPLFAIKTIQVEGNQKITENEIISLSQIQPEENTFQIKKENIRKQIKQNPYIDQVKVIRKLPSTIILQIEERVPAYLLEYAGSYVYLDKQGYLLEISTQKLALPILQGAITETSNFTVGNRLCAEDVEKLFTVFRIMELAKANEIDSFITRIDIEEEQNIKLVLEEKEKTVYIGDSSNLNTKILSVKAILEKTEGIAGEIFVNKDLNNDYPIFRERV